MGWTEDEPAEPDDNKILSDRQSVLATILLMAVFGGPALVVWFGLA